jgi:hypothetical protein
MPRLARRKTSNVVKLTINVIALISGFVFSWTPYAFVSMWCAFKDCNDIPPLLHSYLAIFAKSSMVWAPVLFLFANKNMIINMTQSFKVSRSSQSSCSANRLSRVTRFHYSSYIGKETIPRTDLDNTSDLYESHNVIQRVKSSEEFHLYGKRINKYGLQETFV